MPKKANSNPSHRHLADVVFTIHHPGGNGNSGPDANGPPPPPSPLRGQKRPRSQMSNDGAEGGGWQQSVPRPLSWPPPPPPPPHGHFPPAAQCRGGPGSVALCSGSASAAGNGNSGGAGGGGAPGNTSTDTFYIAQSGGTHSAARYTQVIDFSSTYLPTYQILYLIE